MNELPTRLPPADEIAAINAKHLIKTPLRPADLLFVFGTRTSVTQRVDEACRLGRERYYKWAIVSGGMTSGSHLSECTVIKSAMVAGGVPPDLILEEHRATNTGENVAFSLPIIDAHLGLANIRSVICLGNVWTSRRYLMTMQRYWPQVEKMLVAVNCFGTPVARWHTDPAFRAKVSQSETRSTPTRPTAGSSNGRLTDPEQKDIVSPCERPNPRQLRMATCET